MPFQNLNIAFPTALAFASWLATQPRPQWPPRGATYHNTYKPNADTWAGHASMKSMQAGYEKLGWDRGPHVYLAVGTKHDGIFVMTPPHLPGIHSPSCNGSKTKPGRFGIEVVGDFGQIPMTEAQLDLLVEVAAVLHRYAQIPANLNAHRDCDVRTCPGNAAYAQKPELQRRLAAALATPVPPTPTRYTVDSPLLASPGATVNTLVRTFPAPQPGNEYTAYDRGTIVRAYHAQASAVGVDPVIALAQLCHETGALSSWWSGRPRRNPAGIGVTGDTRPVEDMPPPLPASHWHQDTRVNLWRFGLAFRTWEHHAIPAHLGRLLAYALPEGDGTPMQRLLIASALGLRPLPDRLRGAAPTLQGLEDTWATDGDPTTESKYADHLATWANRLLGGAS